MPHLTGDISAGTILTILTLIGIAIKIGWRLGHIETTIVDHTTRLSLYEQRVVGFIGDLQRLVGRVDAFQERRIDRR